MTGHDGARRYKFRVPLDHAQFFVEDAGASGAAGGSDGDATYRALHRDHLAPTTRGLIVATARWFGDAEVTVEVRSDAPLASLASLEEWDHAARGTLDAHGGVVVVYAPEQTGKTDLPRVALSPGRYHALVLYGGLDSAGDELDPVGSDHYFVALWPARGGDAASDRGVTVLKRGFWCCLQGRHD